jgi:hypothetical protein
MINMNDSEDKLDELMAGYVLGDLRDPGCPLFY